MALLWLALCAALSNAYVYLQSPRGSNNRLDDESRDRRNQRRLFNSMNNGRGGYNRGTGRMYWYEGSVVPMVWTQDNSCNDAGARCTYVIQYYCQEYIRDGWWTESTGYDTIPLQDTSKEDGSQDKCRVDIRRKRWPQGNCTYDYRYGQHESHAYYEECSRRSRNFGLFTGDASFRSNQKSALHTRQNPAGTRAGLECPEERDYYPYWAPSPWRDLAILTDRPERCAEYQRLSQNTMPRYQCEYSEEMHAYAKSRRWTGYVPITQQECEAPTAENVVTDSKGHVLNLGRWVEVPAHNVESPICVTPRHERENTLGNTYDDDGHEAGFNWTVPAWFVEQYGPSGSAIDPERCVIRIRHNLTSNDPGFEFQGYMAADSLEPKLDHTFNPVDEEGEYNANYPTQVPVWERFGMDYSEVEDDFTIEGEDDTPTQGRGYVYKTAPMVDIFGDLTKDAGATKPLYLNLAVNTAKLGRTFQDRTHAFEIRKRPTELEGYRIINLAVKGKRGNIVQTFPGHEYDFHPNRVSDCKEGDVFHIQWNGANTNPRNNAGEGPQGYDRSNIVMLAPQAYEEATKMDMATGEPMLTYGQWGRNYPAHFGYNPENTKTPSEKADEEHGRFLGWDWQSNFILAMPPMYSGYFDFGLKYFELPSGEPTTWNYLATRNNNFSNRSQKGSVTCRPRTEEEGPPLPAPALPDRDAGLVVPGVAYIQYDWDERLNWQQAIHVTEVAGDSGYASPWIKVWPRVVSMPDMGGTMQLNIYHEYKPFHLGRIYWAEGLDPEAYEMIEVTTETDDFSWGSTGKASAWMWQGGYYVVKNELNATALGGAVAGIIAFLGLSFILYRKFGCRFVGGKQYSGASNPLMAGEVSSEAAPAPAAATSVQIQTDTQATS